MWNPIKAYTEHRDAKAAEYQRQEAQKRQEAQVRKETIRAEIRKDVEADHARRAEINRPMTEAHNARQQALRDAEEARQADVLAKALVNNGIMNLGKGTVN